MADINALALIEYRRNVELKSTSLNLIKIGL
jgi:hypothetical protein